MDLVSYVAKWERSIARMQRAHPARWSVRGWSPEEVRDALTLRLVEAGEVEDPMAVVRARLRELRSANRIRQAPGPTDSGLSYAPPPTQEEAWLDAEAAASRATARAKAEAALSKPQRQWYAAMRMAANAGEFFEASGELNLSAAARLLDKNRSSAQRAFAELRTIFSRAKRPSP